MVARSGEFELIARHFAPIAGRAAESLALRDDAAVFAPPLGHEMVVTTDALVADVHFRAIDPPEYIAQKVIRVNLSDLAAMGATPTGVVLTTGFGPDITDDWIASFAKGLGRDCDNFEVALLGGDTVGTPGPTFFNLTAFGAVPSGRALRRDRAEAGDVVAVTGSLGDAALGLAVLGGKVENLSPQMSAYLQDRYWLPQPRVNVGQACVEHGGRFAVMDISDGLAGDIRKMCAASNVGMTIKRDAIPVSDTARQVVLADDTHWSTILGGGDDYELLITGGITDIEALGKAVTIIGEVTDRPGQVDILGPDGKMAELAPGGFDHFKR
ncbi:thiamine-phosphate kinase [Thalassospira sp. MA62]|nr:thiamine-phosphate kinase [Thalassospira sp. MA62]